MEICTWYQVLKFIVATDAVVQVSAGDVFARRRASGMRFEGQIACGTALGGISLFIWAAMGREKCYGGGKLSFGNRRMNGGALQEGLARSTLVSRNSR